MNAELDHNELRGDRLGQMTNDSCFEEEEPFSLLSWRSRDGRIQRGCNWEGI